jgi:hypothetical protein
MLAIINNLGPYRVVDSYGTSKICWSYTEAQEWLRFCAPFAVIYNRWTKKVIAQRVLLPLASAQRVQLNKGK